MARLLKTRSFAYPLALLGLALAFLAVENLPGHAADQTEKFSDLPLMYE